MFKRIIDTFKESLVDEALEADLYLVPKSGAKTGKIEFYRHRSGSLSIRVKLKAGLDLPIASRLSVILNSEEFCDLEYMGEKTVAFYTSKDGHDVPEISSGDKAEVNHRGIALMAGDFEKD